MLKLYALTLIVVVSLPATIYPRQATLKLKAKDVLQRLVHLSENVSVSVCQDGKGYVKELSMYGRSAEGGRRDVYGEMKGALDAIIPKVLRGKFLAFSGGRLPPMDCCDNFIYTYEKVVIEEVLMHGRSYEIKVRVRDEGQPNK